MKFEEWTLKIETNGDIFVAHHNAPKFTVKITIESGQPSPCVRFNAKWEGIKPQTGNSEMEWYLKALEFYNHAPKSN